MANQSPHSLRIILLTLASLLLCITITHGQRDLMTVDQKGHYVLPVIGANGKQLIMAGIDPRSDKPKHPTMCYTTPWNKRSLAKLPEIMDKLHYIAPAWFQLHLDTQISPETKKTALNVKITGHDQIQRDLLEQIWHHWLGRGYVPKVTPRVSLQLTKQSIKLLLNPKTHVSIIESILELVHTGGLPRVNSYKGFDGIVLEMPTVWNNLPGYPNDILTFVEPNPEKEPQKSENHNHNNKTHVPIDPKLANSIESPDQRSDDYGTYHYDFTKASLATHPRHIVNQFVRKLGVALQSGNKSLLIVTAPYQYQLDPLQNFQQKYASSGQSFQQNYDHLNAHQNPAQNHAQSANLSPKDTLWKNFDLLQCQRPHEVKFPAAFSHVDAYYLSPYVDYFSLMSYDFTPEALTDIHHVKDLEKQTRTVATTRIGYNGKRIWRIFNGLSTVSESMFLEDYIREMEEANEDDLATAQEGEKDEKSENDETTPPQTDAEKTQALITLSRKLELDVRSRLKAEIDVLQAKLDQNVHRHDLKRMLPKQEWPMCFNNFIEFHYRWYNPISAECSDQEEPGVWYQSWDIKMYHAIRTNYGEQKEHEEDSGTGIWKTFSDDSYSELIDSVEIHKKKLMSEFALKRDAPWPKVSYGWSVAPTPWMKNSIFGTTIPSMCLRKITSFWNDHRVCNVPIQYAVELVTATLPKTTIMRDLVIPVKLQRIEAQFDFDANLNYMTSLRNETVGVLCQERLQLIEQFERYQMSNQMINQKKKKKNSDDDDDEDVAADNSTITTTITTTTTLNSDEDDTTIPSPPPVDPDLDAACHHQRELVKEEQRIKELERVSGGRGGGGAATTGDVKKKTHKNKNHPKQQQDSRQKDDLDSITIDNENDDNDGSNDAATEPPPQSQLDWSFPTMQLDAHIQNRVDNTPQYNIIRVLAGMNWFGYMYIARDGSGSGSRSDQQQKNDRTNNDGKSSRNGDDIVDLDRGGDLTADGGMTQNQSTDNPTSTTTTTTTTPSSSSLDFFDDLDVIEPIAMTSDQVAKAVIEWKGQVDIRHDLASGDRFFTLRDGPENNSVRTIWYPSYRQLHRKLHNIRSIANGIAVWECGQGTDGFENLL